MLDEKERLHYDGLCVFAEHRGDLVLDIRLIMKTYFSSWFWVDFLAVFPFEGSFGSLGQLE